MKKRIMLLAVMAVVAVCAVAVGLPLQAALADAPPEVKAVMTFVQATWENGKLTVTQGIPGGAVKTVDCPEGSATSVQFHAAEGQAGEPPPFEVKCFELEPDTVVPLPDGEGGFTISTAPFDASNTANCVGAEPLQAIEGELEPMEQFTIVEAPESGIEALPATVMGTAVVVNCGGETRAEEE